MTFRIALCRIIFTDRERVGTLMAPTLCRVERQSVGALLLKEQNAVFSKLHAGGVYTKEG